MVLDVADGLPDDPDRADALPVIYVVSVGEEPFSAQVQASVASSVTDTVDVRFADVRDESLDKERPGQPVKDGGVLVLIGKIVADEAPMTIDVEVYRSTTQFSRRTVTFGRRGDEWSSSAVSVLEELDVAPTTLPPGDAEDGAPLASTPVVSSAVSGS